MTEALSDTAAARSPAADVAAAAVIEVDGLGKCYQIYSNPRDRFLQGLWRGRKQYYREFWALRDVAFSVRRGETLGIIGANGSGKSTMLQLICGTQMPTSGAVRVDGRVAALLELGTGFNPEFTGRENVYLCARVHGLSGREIDDRFADIERFADIGEFIDQPVKTYSSGMYVRLAFAVMAHVDADVLVIDEALAVGDALFTQKCMRFLRAFRRTGTLLFASHDIGAVTGLCDRAVWLDHGRLRMIASAKSVCEAYLAATIESVQGPPVEAPGERVAGERRAGQGANAEDGRGTAAGGTGSASGAEVAAGSRRERANGNGGKRRAGSRAAGGHTPEHGGNAAGERNEIRLRRFDPDAPGFGKGGAKITDVRLLDEAGNPMSHVVGGETVTVHIEAKALQALTRPLIGFIVKDRLGQALFADNTIVAYADRPVKVRPGDTVEARFEFQMPILPVGDYSVTVSIAEGTQHENVQHHWIHDALIVKSVTSSVCTGLVGVPMKRIELTSSSP